MKHKNKFIYLFVIQGDYGYGWDDIYHTENWRDAYENLKLYKGNEPRCPHRMIKRRVLNDS